MSVCEGGSVIRELDVASWDFAIVELQQRKGTVSNGGNENIF